MPLPNWSSSLPRNNTKAHKHRCSRLVNAIAKDTESAENVLLCKVLSPFKDFFTSDFEQLCLWASVFKSCFQGLDTHTNRYANRHVHRSTTDAHTQNTKKGLYGYTDRFGGLECLKKTSDCFGVSLLGSTSSFLKQAERRLQRGTRENKRWKLRTSYIQTNGVQKPILLRSWS